MQDDLRTLLALRIMMGCSMASITLMLCFGIINRNPTAKVIYGLGATTFLSTLIPVANAERRINRRIRQTDETAAIDWSQQLTHPLITFWKQGTELRGQAYQPEEPFTGLEEVDIAECLATARNGSTMIACPSGTGKSNLLRAAIAHAHRHYGGAVQFKVVAGKSDETYAGLETTADYVESSPDAAEEVYGAFCHVRNVINAPGLPAILIADEYNNTLGDLDTASKEIFKRAKRTNYEIVTKGRSKGVYGWFTSHSPFVQDMGFNSAIQESFNVICLGRGNKTASIYKALSGKRSVIDDDERREFLNWQFKEYKKSDDYDGDRVICLTNIRGEWELVILPIYEDCPPNITTSQDVEVPLPSAVSPLPLPANFPADVSREVPAQSQLTQLTPQHQRQLYHLVRQHLAQGHSKTYIIEKVLEQGGRKFADTSQLIDEVLLIGKIQGWGN
jgi:hypothetical protein